MCVCGGGGGQGGGGGEGGRVERQVVRDRRGKKNGKSR